MTFRHLTTKWLVKSTTQLSESSTFRPPPKKNGQRSKSGKGSSSKHPFSSWNLLSVFSIVPGTRNIHELNWLFQLDGSKSLHEKQVFKIGCLGFQVEIAQV